MVRTTAHCLTESGKKHLFIPCFTEGKDMAEMFLAVLWSVGASLWDKSRDICQEAASIDKGKAIVWKQYRSQGGTDQKISVLC